MDVWPRCYCVGCTEKMRTVLNRIPQIAWGKPFHQVRGNLRFPLTVTYHGCPRNVSNEEKSQETSCLCGVVAGRCLVWVRSVSGPPAGPHVFVDCARELTLPIHPIVCFEVGWFTLTQSSWTKLHRSRKWMSGHAATALVTRRIEDSSEPYPANRLGKAIPPSQGESPFSLDGYLSWMSTGFRTSVGRTAARTCGSHESKPDEGSITSAERRRRAGNLLSGDFWGICKQVAEEISCAMLPGQSRGGQIFRPIRRETS